jgi:ribosome biogenesis GTPase
VVLDTPGVRAVGLFDPGTGSPDDDPGPGAGRFGADAGLDRVFAEIDVLAGRCRFADCAHDREPGCAVRAALATGELSARRFDSWCKLRRELDGEAHRREVRLAAESGARWKGQYQQRRAARWVRHSHG